MRFKYCVKYVYLALRNAILSLCFRREKTEEINPGFVKSILIIRIDRIGDVVVSLPAIKALKRIFPHAKISVLLREEIAPLLKSVPWIDELLPYRGLFDSIGILSQKRFSMAVDLLMDYTIKPAIIAFLSKAGLRVGFDIESRGRLFNLTIKPDGEKKDIGSYMSDLVGKVAKASGMDASRIGISAPEIILSGEDRDFARGFLIKNNIGKDDILIGLHPGGRYPSQRWMPESFSELAIGISGIYNARIIVMGSQAETKLVERIASSTTPRAITAIGLALDKIAALIEKTDIFVCNNSGPWHIACALGVPTVSTMGPTDYYLWRPVGEGHIVVRKELSCSPCDLAACGSHNCMKMISVKDMMEAFRAQIEHIKDKRKGS